MTGELSAVPTHLGLILDGNRRWAVAKELPPMEGHRLGYQNLKTIGRAALARGVEYVSAYAFSTENWHRSETEVSYLMDLLLWVAQEDVRELHEEGVRVRFLGARNDTRLSTEIVQAMNRAEELTAGNNKGNLGICLNYGGRQEIVDAVRRIVSEGIPADEIDEATLDARMYAPDFPPVDLIIRPGGVLRTSNFMTWLGTYSEFYFTPKLWPDFTPEDLDVAFESFRSIERRFGGDPAKTV